MSVSRKRVDQVLGVVAARTEIPVEAMRGPSRATRVLEARRLAAYVLRHAVGLPYSEIGIVLGVPGQPKNHSSVLAQVRAVSALLAAGDARVADDVAALSKSVVALDAVGEKKPAGWSGRRRLEDSRDAVTRKFTLPSGSDGVVALSVEDADALLALLKAILGGEDVPREDVAGIRSKIAAIRGRVDAGGDKVDFYFHLGLYPDGAPGELFVRASKQGEFMSGVLDLLGVFFSLALQYGCPFEKLVEKSRRTNFLPSGFTGDPEFPRASSFMDAFAQWAEARVLPPPASVVAAPADAPTEVPAVAEVK